MLHNAFFVRFIPFGGQLRKLRCNCVRVAVLRWTGKRNEADALLYRACAQRVRSMAGVAVLDRRPIGGAKDYPKPRPARVFFVWGIEKTKPQRAVITKASIFNDGDASRTCRNATSESQKSKTPAIRNHQGFYFSRIS